jgi:hypothetical protein
MGITQNCVQNVNHSCFINSWFLIPKQIILSVIYIWWKITALSGLMRNPSRRWKYTTSRFINFDTSIILRFSLLRLLIRLRHPIDTTCISHMWVLFYAISIWIRTNCNLFIKIICLLIWIFFPIAGPVGIKIVLLLYITTDNCILVSSRMLVLLSFFHL